jgi:hypothetical protein
MTHLPSQGVGGLGQDPALNHEHVAFEASNASKTLIYTYCNPMILVSAVKSLRIKI